MNICRIKWVLLVNPNSVIGFATMNIKPIKNILGYGGIKCIYQCTIG
jgi:hypothetical protein